MRQLAWSVIVAAACRHPPPPKAPPVERPVTSFGDVTGHWVTSDDLDWGYTLLIGTDGAFDLSVDRNKLGRCEQKGMVTNGAAGTFQLVFSANDCNRDYAGAGLQLKVTSFTGESLTITIVGFGTQETHTYKRDPKFPLRPNPLIEGAPPVSAK